MSNPAGKYSSYRLLWALNFISSTWNPIFAAMVLESLIELAGKESSGNFIIFCFVGIESNLLPYMMDDTVWELFYFFYPCLGFVIVKVTTWLFSFLHQLYSPVCWFWYGYISKCLLAEILSFSWGAGSLSWTIELVN